MTSAQNRTARISWFQRETESSRFSNFYQKHQSLIRTLIFQMIGENDIDDVTQDVFIKAWQAFPQFRRSSNEKTWLYRIAVHSCIDHLRKKRPIVNLEEGPTLSDLTTENDNPLENQEIVSRLLKSLSIEHRTVIVLFSIQGFTISEIAKTLEKPEGTIKSRLFTAKEKSKKILKKLGVHYG